MRVGGPVERVCGEVGRRGGWAGGGRSWQRTSLLRWLGWMSRWASWRRRCSDVW